MSTPYFVVMKEIRELRGRLVVLEEAQRQNKASRWKRAEELWSQPELTAAQIAAETGFSRGGLYRKLGPRGTPRFGKVAR